MDLRVVEHDDGDAQCLAQCCPRIEAMPLLHQCRIDARAGPAHSDVVGSSYHHAVPDHSRQANGRMCGVRKLLGEVDEGLDEELRRQGIRRRYTDRLGTHGAGIVEDGCLDPASTAVDDEGRGRGVFCAHATAVCRVRPRPGNLTRQVLGGVA